jgi:hypothetical protein
LGVSAPEKNQMGDVSLRRPVKAEPAAVGISQVTIGPPNLLVGTCCSFSVIHLYIDASLSHDMLVPFD